MPGIGMVKALPGGELIISAFVQDGNDFAIRFVNDFHPEVISEGEAFCLKLEGVCEARILARYLAEHFEAESGLYLLLDGQSIRFDSDSGETLSVNFVSAESQMDPHNVDELRKSLSRVYAWHCQESALIRDLQSKLNRIDAFILDQMHRTEIKANSHEDSSTAAMLYRQQIDLLNRISRLLASDG